MCEPIKSLVHRQGYPVLLGHAPQVQYGIAHPSEGGIDADSRHFCYFFEAQVLVKAHVDHFALFFRQVLHQAAHIRDNLSVYDFRLYCSFGEADIVQQVPFFFVAEDEVLLFLLSETVDDKVMRNACEPGGELSVFVVTSLLDGDDGFCESLLEDVFRQFFIAHGVIDVRIEPVFVAVQQDIERFIIALCIEGYQLFVGSGELFFHYVYLFLFFSVMSFDRRSMFLGVINIAQRKEIFGKRTRLWMIN